MEHYGYRWVGMWAILITLVLSLSLSPPPPSLFVSRSVNKHMPISITVGETLSISGCQAILFIACLSFIYSALHQQIGLPTKRPTD